VAWSYAVVAGAVIVIALMAIYVPTIYIRKTNKLISPLERIEANTRKELLAYFLDCGALASLQPHAASRGRGRVAVPSPCRIGRSGVRYHPKYPRLLPRQFSERQMLAAKNPLRS